MLLGLVFRGSQLVGNISGNRDEMSNRIRKVRMPNKYLLNEMVLVTVRSFYFLFLNFFGNRLDFLTLQSSELFEH